MKILIMEDNDVVIDVLTFLLKKDNFEVAIARDDSAASRWLESGAFDIFLMCPKSSKNPQEEINFIRYVYTEKFNPYMKIIVAGNGNKNKLIGSAFLGVGADIITDKIPISNLVEVIKNIAATISLSP